MQMKRIIRPLEIKSIEGSGTFTGYGSVFGNLDSYKEIVVKGAFSNSLALKKPREVKLLWQHNSEKPIGVYTQLKEDEQGLYVEGQLAVNDVQQAREAYALLKMGALDGLSIGFTVKESGMTREKDILYLNDIDLWEISIVTFPANPLANIESVKSAEEIKTIRDFENHLREVGFSSSQAKRIASQGFKAMCEQRDVDTQDAELITSLQKLSETIKELNHG